ncbi:unnamed protein product [Owenia fusiformis]|uniref:Fibronectin type-III domain-containing protein n=1 Tax=Owenia fusiformis TaxID=6347 RepID=A0A8S4N1N6_OWEFU|nr:unnamed protein product [Owenia fusiformis]
MEELQIRCLIFLAMFCMIPTATNANIYDLYGVMLPHNPVWAVGSTHDLICNLTRNQTSYTTDDLYFIFKSHPLPRECYVTLPEYPAGATNETGSKNAVPVIAIQLHIENVTIDDRGYYSCFLNISSVDMTKHKMVYMQEAKVGYAPSKPVNIQCRSYQWKGMTCTWDIGRDPLIPTEWTLYYTLDFNESIRCPHNGKHSCEWKDEKFVHPATKFGLVIEAENELGKEESEQVVINTSVIVEVAPVNEIQCKALNNTSIEILWSHAKDADIPVILPLIYDVLYKGQWDEDWTKLSVDGDYNLNLSRTIRTLHSYYTTYTIAIRCKPKQGLYWSEWKNSTIRTEPARPSGPPKFGPGSFYITKCPGSSTTCQNIKILWQEVAAYQRNGDIISHIITASTIEGNTTKSTVKNHISFSNLKRDTPYIFYVTSLNSKGMSPEAQLMLDTGISAPPNVQNGYVEHQMNGSLLVKWTNPEELAHQMYYVTVYWCEGSPNHECREGSDLIWRRVSHGENELLLELDLTESVQYNVAISVEVANTSSGMTDWLCSVWHDSVPKTAPSDLRLTEQSERSLSIAWKGAPSCHESKVFIQGYILNICQWTAEAHCLNGTANVTRVGPGITSHMFGELMPNTDYEVHIRSYTNLDEGPKSSKLHIFRTNPSAPSSSPTGLYIRNVTASSVSLGWNPSPTTNGNITHYIVEYMSDVLNGSCEVSGNMTMSTVHNLHGQVLYSFLVKACVLESHNPCSPPSDRVQALTHMGEPGMVLNFQMETLKNASLKLEWDSPLITNGLHTMYTIRIESADGSSNVNTVRVANMTEDIIDFDCDNISNEPVNVSIQAVNEDHGELLSGPWSSVEQLEICATGVNITLLIVSCVIGAVVLAVFLAVCIRYSRIFYKKVSERQEITVPQDSSVPFNTQVFDSEPGIYTRMLSQASSTSDHGYAKPYGDLPQTLGNRPEIAPLLVPDTLYLAGTNTTGATGETDLGESAIELVEVIPSPSEVGAAEEASVVLKAQSDVESEPGGTQCESQPNGNTPVESNGTLGLYQHLHAPCICVNEDGYVDDINIVNQVHATMQSPFQSEMYIPKHIPGTKMHNKDDKQLKTLECLGSNESVKTENVSLEDNTSSGFGTIPSSGTPYYLDSYTPVGMDAGQSTKEPYRNSDLSEISTSCPQESAAPSLRDDSEDSHTAHSHGLKRNSNNSELDQDFSTNLKHEDNYYDSGCQDVHPDGHDFVNDEDDINNDIGIVKNVDVPPDSIAHINTALDMHSTGNVRKKAQHTPIDKEMLDNVVAFKPENMSNSNKYEITDIDSGSSYGNTEDISKE